MAELAAKYNLHPNVIAQWKRQARESLSEVFARKTSRIGRTGGRGEDAARQDRAVDRRERFFVSRLPSLSRDRREAMIDPHHPPALCRAPVHLGRPVAVAVHLLLLGPRGKCLNRQVMRCLDGLHTRQVALRPSTPEASEMSLPTSPLRLLPTGATFVGWDSHPLKIRAFSRRTEFNWLQRCSGWFWIWMFVNNCKISAFSKSETVRICRVSERLPSTCSCFLTMATSTYVLMAIQI